MKYHIDENKVSLFDLLKRIKKSDLVPSRSSLLENIEAIFDVIKKQGVKTFGDLRKELKTPAKVKTFSTNSNIDEEYLILLRREVNSYFPKVYPLKELSWLSKEECSKLKGIGLDNTKKIYETLVHKEEFESIKKECEIENKFLLEVLSIVDLMRIQWTSPLAARMFYESGYTSPNEIAGAEAEALCNSVDKVNKENGYFKGKIGLRDIKRLINSAKYVAV